MWNKAFFISLILPALFLCVFSACNPLGDFMAIEESGQYGAEPPYGTWEIYRMERSKATRTDTLRSPGISGTITFYRNSDVMAIQLSDSTGLPVEPFALIHVVNQPFILSDFGKEISAGRYSFSVELAGNSLTLATSIDADSGTVGVKFYSTRK